MKPSTPNTEPQSSTRFRKLVAGVSICILSALWTVGCGTVGKPPESGFASNAGNETRFFDLCKTGTVSQIEQAIKAGADANAKDAEGMTPLMQAVSNDQALDVIAALVKAGADVNAKGAKGVTPLMLAASHSANPKPIITSVVRQPEGSDKLTLFYGTPAPDVIEALLHAGANVNATNSFGVTPLHCAASGNKNARVVDALVKAGADVNAKDGDGNTPLFFAVRGCIWRGKSISQVVESLVKAGANVSARNQKGETPLMWAKMTVQSYRSEIPPSPETVQVLIEAGAK